MKPFYKIFSVVVLILLLGATATQAQINIRGKVLDNDTGEELIGAAVALVNIGGGTITNYEGDFLLAVDALPVTIRVSYTGFTTQEVQVTDASNKLTIKMEANTVIIEETVVRGQRIDEKQKTAPLSVENLDAIAIKETAAVSFYNG
ncbi:MAG: carboxypeptidase-like regulatory domain-containing protein, partial [Saprospiraceae bacterium]|nr:carboxypeptidase-like regulatory domain-containing protein [Saprospiraceae bacterium]